jgi:hypothetical protein
MKKRTKLSLRTTIYLTIVALLALTGVFYAANPDKFATVPKSVAAPDAPMASPTPFASVPGPVGVAAVPDTVLVTEFCDQNLNRIDCDGNVSLVTTIPAPSPAGTCIEKYMAVAPIQSTAAGFTPRDIFITQKDDIYKFSGGILTPFVLGFGCPLSDHTAITFDHVGTFGFDMIVTCENGLVVKIDNLGGTPHVTPLAFLAGSHLEGPAVVPLSFGPLGGQILAADDINGVVDAIKNDGTVTLNAFNWTPPDWDGAESVQVIPSNPCPNCSGGAFFQAVYTSNLIYKYPPADFTGLGGNVLVNSENQHGTALVTFDGTNYVTTLFDNLPGNQEGASFVDCDVPTPTPSPTPTPEIPTPTPSPTPTATPATCTGLFVIGDRDAVVGQHVTFWGAQWWKKNHLSGGTAPASFKGFANCANPPCGGTWISDPGNSSHPPDTVPADMTVIVSSLITKSGPIESGNIPMMVTIHTDPGYQPNPGHEGTGTVTAVVCGSAHRPQYHQPARPARPPR